MLYTYGGYVKPLTGCAVVECRVCMDHCAYVFFAVHYTVCIEFIYEKIRVLNYSMKKMHSIFCTECAIEKY